MLMGLDVDIGFEQIVKKVQMGLGLGRRIVIKCSVVFICHTVSLSIDFPKTIMLGLCFGMLVTKQQHVHCSCR